MIRLLISLLFVLSFMGAPALAQAPVDTELDTTIEIGNTGQSDKAIQKRIEGIFAELDGLSNIQVNVSEGVVTLSGDTASEELAQRALRLAVRPVGVVTVEDNIERTLDIEGNVAPVIQEFQDGFAKFVKALPLMAVAGALWLLMSLVGLGLSRLSGLWAKVAPNKFLADIISQMVRWGFFVIGAVVAFDLLGGMRYLTPLLGGFGVIGIAVGFAVRDTLENYISSIMLSLRQPFRAKDHVRINAHEGIVVRLTSRATILRTLDGNHLRIPNSDVFKAVILNFSTNPERRFSFEVGVDPADDPIAAIHEGVDAIAEHSFVLTEPAPSGTIANIGDSNVMLKFSAWVNQDETSFGKARSLAIRAVTSHLENKGFTLPEPVYRLRMDGDISDIVTETKSVPPVSMEGNMPLKADMDVKPDNHLEEQIDEELALEKHPDLLDDNRPVE